MTNTITLQEPTTTALMANWTGIRLERGPNATNIGAFSLVALIPYVVGQTTYSIVDGSGAPSDWYRVARYGPLGLLGPYSPAWPVSPLPITTGDGTRRSLKNCRRMLARRLQSLQVATMTADGNVGGTTIISTQLATQIDGNRYRNWYAMPTDGVSAGVIRVIGDNALNPADGTMTITPAFTSQVVLGTQVEFHHYLPPDELGGLQGLRQALNLALAECWVMDRLAVAAVSDTASYDLSSLGDWLDPEAISEYYGPQLASGIPLSPWGGWNARREGAAVYLDVAPGLAGGAATKPEITRPADTLIKIGGVWTDNQQGFVNDDDECLLQPSFVVQVALAHCYDWLADSTTGLAKAAYTKKAGEQRTKVNRAKYTGLPHPPERSNHARATYSGDSDWTSWLK